MSKPFRMLLSPKTASEMMTGVGATTIVLGKLLCEHYIALYHEKMKITHGDQFDNSYNEYKIEI